MSSEPIPTMEVMEQVHNFFDDNPHAWMQGTLARDDKDRAVLPQALIATKFSLEGYLLHLHNSYAEDNMISSWTNSAYKSNLQLLVDLVRIVFPKYREVTCLKDWHDDPTTALDHVLILVDLAQIVAGVRDDV